MRCPKCETRLRTLDSRFGKTSGTIRRRRKCDTCSTRYTTVETFKDDLLASWVSEDRDPDADDLAETSRHPRPPFPEEAE